MSSLNPDSTIAMVLFLLTLGSKEAGTKEVDSPTVAIFDESWNTIVRTSVINSGVEKIAVCTDNHEHSSLKNKEPP